MRRMIFLALLAMPQLAAHPHVFIESLLAPKTSPDGRILQGVEIRWTFDQLYSAQMILDFDRDRSSTIDSDEGQQIYEEAFVHLKELDYFLQHNGDFQIGTASNFQASIEDYKLIYQFYVPLIAADLDKDKEYILYLEDMEYFIAFETLLEPSINSPRVRFDSKPFTIKNPQWGDYSVRAVSVQRH